MNNEVEHRDRKSVWDRPVPPPPPREPVSPPTPQDRNTASR